MTSPFGFAVNVPKRAPRRGPQDIPAAPFGFAPPPSKMQQTLAILNEYNPLPAFGRLLNSPMALGGPISEQDIADGLTIGGSVMGGGSVVPKPRNALNMGIKAFHGSPHSFDKFSMDKIGTGEGAQAYGHGLYFAENEGIAKTYRDDLSRYKWDIDVPHEISDSLVQNGADPRVVQTARITLDQFGGDAVKALHSLDKTVEYTGSEVSRKASELIRSLRPETMPPGGSMYEVNINADPNAFLDWDKPLSEQPESVKQVLRPLVGDSLEAQPGRDYQTGEQFYRDFVGKIGGQRDKLISKYGDEAYFRNAGDLANRELGIPGIKYLDAGSRGAGDGTRNYVVFDDKLIEIVRKYGIAGASAMLGYNILDGMDPAQADELKRIEGNQ